VTPVVALEWVRDQVVYARRVGRDHGWRAVVGERIAAALRSSPTWLAASEQQRQVSDEALAAVRQDIDHLRRSLTDLDGRLGGVHQFGGALRAELDAARAELDATRVALDQWLWWSNAPLRHHPLVSVILPTGFADRSDYLRSAISSVLGQSYGNWELLVVDDTPEAAYAGALPSWWPHDPRVKILASGGSGQSAARNLALDAASGTIIAYLDDDCRWFPWWLHALVATFADTSVDAVHGVRVIEEPGGLATAFVRRIDAIELHRINPADTNIVGHRAALSGTRWSSERESCCDYDFAVDLGAVNWRFVPVPAATYSMSAPHRRWVAERADVNHANLTEIGRRARRQRPLRIVAHNGLYPQITETYIGDELEALRRCDIDIVLSRSQPAVVESASRIDVPLYESLVDAIDAHDPDLVLAHWAGVAIDARGVCVAAGVPMAVRTHSFDGDIGPDQLIDQWCIGTWHTPSRDLTHPRQFRLPTLIVDPPTDTHTGRRDRSVLSVSAGLPKKGWPTLMDAMRKLPDTTMELIVGHTNGFEWIPAFVADCAAERGLSPAVRIDVSYDEVQSAMRSEGVLVYAINPSEHLGQPRSIIEGAIAGIPLVVPDHPSMKRLIGECAHFYDRGDAGSLAAALADALDSPHAALDRLALAQRIRAEHSSSAVFEAWAGSLTDAFLDWRHDTPSNAEGRLIRWWNTLA
jgi:glycosyltransferase involved in cell wall biosynthesis